MKEKIHKKSISLKQYGMNDLAWSKSDAQSLIQSIMKDEIGILGGDVYKLTSDRLIPLYENWFCDIPLVFQTPVFSVSATSDLNPAASPLFLTDPASRPVCDLIQLRGADLEKSQRLNSSQYRIKNESKEDCYLRSKKESLEYINNYHILSEEIIVFSLTFTDMPRELQE